MYVPGQILHIYRHHGIYKCAMVPREHVSLQKIELSESMFRDHLGQNYIDILRNMRLYRDTPKFHPYNISEVCERCNTGTW